VANNSLNIFVVIRIMNFFHKEYGVKGQVIQRVRTVTLYVIYNEDTCIKKVQVSTFGGSVSSPRTSCYYLR